MLRRRVLAFLALLCLLTEDKVVAQITDITGVWEATSARIEGHASHHVLKFTSDNSYEYTLLSDHPSNSLLTHRGIFSQSTDQIILNPSDPAFPIDTLKISSEISFTDTNPISTVEFFRGQEFSDDIHGTWALFGPDGNSTGGTFTVLPDGLFETDVSTGQEKGWYVIAGTAMVHFPTETSDPKLLGIPGLWTHLNVSDGILSYRIAGTEITITGRKIVTSSVQVMTWSRIKTEISVKNFSNGR